MATVDLSGTAAGSSSAGASLSVWSSTWLIMFDGAARMARELFQLEAGFGPVEPNQYTPEQVQAIQRCRALVLGGMMMACSGIESFINEIFLREIDSKGAWQPTLFDAPTITIVSETWDDHIERLAPLEKIQLALKLAKRAPFDRGKDPFQSVKLAMDLRNAFVHYKPQWDTETDRDRATHKPLDRALRGRFALGRPERGSNGFPHAYFAHGCLEWVVKSTWGLVEAFHAQAGIKMDPLHTDWSVATT